MHEGYKAKISESRRQELLKEMLTKRNEENEFYIKHLRIEDIDNVFKDKMREHL